jgi:threonine aldolase
VETNIVFFKVDREFGTAKEVATTLKQNGVLVLIDGSHTLRACTHLDVSSAQAEQAAATIRKALRRLAPAR